MRSAIAACATASNVFAVSVSIIATLVGVCAAHAGPAWDWAGPGFTNFSNYSYNFGLNFSVDTQTAVTGLGYYDAGGNGFTDNHEVALFSSAGTLLASGTVTTADPLTGNFRFLSIAPLVLDVGTYQVVGVSHSDLYSFEAQPGGIPNTIYDPSITLLNNCYHEDTGPPVFVTGAGVTDFCFLPNVGGSGIFGPNVFLGQALNSVPEPATLTLFGVGLVGAVATRRRKFRTA